RNAAPSEQQQRDPAHTRRAGHHAEHAGPSALGSEIDQQRPWIEFQREGRSGQEAAQIVAVSRERIESESNQKQQEDIILAINKIRHQRSIPAQEQNREILPPDARHSRKEADNGGQQNQVKNKPDALSGQRRVAGNGDYRQHGGRRLRYV